LQIKTKIVSTHTADSKPVKQEVNGTVILPPLVFPDYIQLPWCKISQMWNSYLGEINLITKVFVAVGGG
jgi:hypothetical protein